MAKKGTLLIIDDEQSVLDSISSIMEDDVAKILLASNGREGLEYFENEQIDCVVCDVNMPELNGVALIKKIRAMKNEVPFIFYTGFASRDLMLEVVKYGAFDFLEKPDTEHLKEVILKGISVGANQESENIESDFISEFKKLMMDLPSK
jgi:DNA-binding NtrC family response regulator